MGDEHTGLLIDGKKLLVVELSICLQQLLEYMGSYFAQYFDKSLEIILKLMKVTFSRDIQLVAIRSLKFFLKVFTSQQLKEDCFVKILNELKEILNSEIDDFEDDESMLLAALN
jgi:hypothetical protein